MHRLRPHDVKTGNIHYFSGIFLYKQVGKTIRAKVICPNTLYGCVGHAPCLPTQLIAPRIHAFLNSLSMAKNIINHIDTYNDHSRSVTINGANTNVADLIRSFMAEDVEPADEPQPKSKLPFLVVEKLMELKLYSLQEFEDKYRKAVKGGVKTLAAFLKMYRDLQVLDFQGKDKKQIHAVLQAFFPDDITYGYTNFATYF